MSRYTMRDKIALAEEWLDKLIDDEGPIGLKETTEIVTAIGVLDIADSLRKLVAAAENDAFTGRNFIAGGVGL